MRTDATLFFGSRSVTRSKTATSARAGVPLGFPCHEPDACCGDRGEDDLYEVSRMSPPMPLDFARGRHATSGHTEVRNRGKVAQGHHSSSVQSEVRRWILTPPSSGHPPAGFACLRLPLMSNYKGFPAVNQRQAMTNRAAIRQWGSKTDRRAGRGIDDGAKCGLDKLQPVIVQSCAADPDERRARGPHSLAEHGGCRLLELIRHSPRRSNLCSSTPRRHAVVDSIGAVATPRA